MLTTSHPPNTHRSSDPATASQEGDTSVTFSAQPLRETYGCDHTMVLQKQIVFGTFSLTRSVRAATPSLLPSRSNLSSSSQSQAIHGHRASSKQASGPGHTGRGGRTLLRGRRPGWLWLRWVGCRSSRGDERGHACCFESGS